MNITGHDVQPLSLDLLLSLVIFLLLELGSLRLTGKLYSALFLDHIKDLIMSVAHELVSDRSGKKMCGTVLAILIIAVLLFLVYGVHSILTHKDAREQILFTLVMVLFCLPLLVLFHYVNQRYISWVKIHKLT